MVDLLSLHIIILIQYIFNHYEYFIVSSPTASPFKDRLKHVSAAGLLVALRDIFC